MNNNSFLRYMSNLYNYNIVIKDYKFIKILKNCRFLPAGVENQSFIGRATRVDENDISLLNIPQYRLKKAFRELCDLTGFCPMIVLRSFTLPIEFLRAVRDFI